MSSEAIPPVTAPTVVEPRTELSGPTKLVITARPASTIEPPPPPAAKEPPKAPKAPKAEDVLALYQSLGRELKSIADRRDMAADDLWVRYRRVRIQDVIASEKQRGSGLHQVQPILPPPAPRQRFVSTICH